MTVQNTDFGRVADDLRRAASSFALLTSNATAFGASLSAFREFQGALIQTNTIAGGTAKNYAQMEKAARNFSLATTTTATEAVGALQNLAQAGFTVQESLAAMSGVLLLASATMSDISVASDLLSSNIRAFGLETTDSARVANLFTAAMNSSLATMDKLTFALRQVGPVASVANLSIEETTAYLNELFNVGLRGEQAGTALRNIIVRLVRPTGEAAKILRELGIATVDATGNFRPLLDILQELDQANLGESQLAKIFENEALAGAITLMKAVRKEADGTASSYEKMLIKISGTQDALVNTLKNLSSFDSQMKLLQNSVTDLAITMGEALAPYVIMIAEKIRDLLQAFRDLDPETKQMYTNILLFGSAIVGSLAIVNALMLLLGGATLAFLKFNAVMMGMPIVAIMASFGYLVGGLKGLTAALIASVAAMVAWRAYAAGTLLTTIRSVTLAIGLMAFVNPVTVAFTALAGVAAIATGAFYLLRGESEATRKELERLAKIRIDTSEWFDRKAASAGVGDLALKQLQQEGEIARQLGDSDLLRALGENDFGTAIKGAQTGTTMAMALTDELRARNVALGESMKEVKSARDILVAGIEEVNSGPMANLKNNASWLTGGLLIDSVNTDLEQALNADNPRALQLIREYGVKEAAIVAEIEKNKETIKINQAAEAFAIGALVQAVAIGEQQLPGIYADLGEGVATFLQTRSKAQLDALVKGLAEGDKDFTDVDFIVAIMRERGDSEEAIAEVIGREEKARVAKIVFDLAKLADDMDLENEKVRIAILEFTADNSKSLEEAVAAGLEAGNATLEIDLNELFTEFSEKNGEALTSTILQNQKGVQEAINEATKGNDFGIDTSDDLLEILGGKPLIDAINDQIDADTTPEELAEIARVEGAKYKEMVQTMLRLIQAALKDSANAITDDQLAEITRLAESQGQRILDAITLTGLETGKDQETITKRFEKDADKAKKAADKAMKELKDALKDAREIDDAFLAATEAAHEARQRYVDMLRGLDVSERITLSLDFELFEINKNADDQIRDIQRSIEDFEIDFKGTPAQLAAIKAQYGEVIVEINRARDAEIAAASSFTAQMDRRSKAIDLFIRDLNDIGIASKDTFTQVGAGIASAFAEYQKDLVTLIDITKDATTDLLDTITTGIGDFIFENESAWDNFKKNMLNISRKIFEGFTKALLQQTISSLTGGEGSVLGNALQPSPYGKEGTPGVGTGGIFGKMFKGLGAAFGLKPAGGGTADPMVSSAASLSSSAMSLQSSAVSLQSIAAAMGAGGFSGMTGGLGGMVGGAVQGAFPGASAAMGSVFDAGMGMVDGVVTSLKDGIIETAAALNINPLDLATVISYETGGTFDPRKKGPTTQWGQHQGLIQFGEPQAAQYGVDFSSDMSALTTQLGPNGAIVQYLTAAGFKPGMSKMDLYSTINAGGPGRYGASDAGNGGAPGTVFDKVNNQMAGHLKNAEQLFGDFNEGMEASTSGLQNIVGGIPKSVFNTEGVTPEAMSALANLEGISGKTFDINSAFRDAAYNADVGGAKGSQHIQGNAFDVNVIGYSNEAKNLLIEQARASGFGGVGVYDNALHFDKGAERAWGSDYTSATIPDWAKASLQTPTGAVPSYGGGQQPTYGAAIGAVTGQAGVPGMPGAGGDLTGLSQQFAQTFQQFNTAISQTLDQFGQQFSQALNKALQQMGGTGTVGFSGGAKGGVGAGGLGGLLSGIGSLFGFAEGGYTGNGGKFDPAGIVHAGEFVNHADATKEFRPLLEAINRGDIDKKTAAMVMGAMGTSLPGFALGGFVGMGGGTSLSRATPSAALNGVLGKSSSPFVAAKQERAPDNIALNVTYNITGGQQPDNFARSANQHSKVLMRQIERAKRNN